MTPAIAIVGMACRYPDARSPSELWENALAQRRAFRRMPSERFRCEDYFAADRQEPDHTYSVEAALIEGYEFDRVRFRVVGSTYRAADLAHWLALDIAAQALADAGFTEGEGLPRETTGVLVGNTLTGEFSRANVLRLRWPYVRRVIGAALVEEGWPPDQRRKFLKRLETQYKAPFPPVGEETLAGGLSNTIAGRICNHFDLKGGGYTVDGACASSLLAVNTACSGLTAGDLDVALAGGVDLSLDPFELVGFAKAGALANGEMRVYDVRSAGFWPGEGCGFVVLMRHEDAVAEGRRIYAVIRGCGISSDGSGGITRPEVEGQLLALRHAYRRAGFGIDSVSYFEGHGTGTSVGDATELQVVSRARREAAPAAPPAAIGSIKANIGHTKAAAGVAGLIKATMALHTRILPPTTGCHEPHHELTSTRPALRVLSQAEPWPLDRPLRAAVSSMGFGGINAHVVLEGTTTSQPDPRYKTFLQTTTTQDCEILLLGARNADGLLEQVERLLTFADRLSRAEVTDLAAQLARILGESSVRAAVVASNAAELTARLETLRTWLLPGERADETCNRSSQIRNSKTKSRLDSEAGVFLGTGTSQPRIAFLFPGQGSPAHLDGGAWRRRFDSVGRLYARADLPTSGDGRATAVAQPAIVTASLAGLRTLEHLGIKATVAIGHSLGELTAYHWAGALDEESVLRLAAARGKVMNDLGSPTGSMASIGVGHQQVLEMLDGEPIVIAGLNSPQQTVISGDATSVTRIVARAQARGLRAMSLPVSHAFHSPLVATAAPALAEQLNREAFESLQLPVVSTVTGTRLSPDADLRQLLYRQVTSPVRFMEAVTTALGSDTQESRIQGDLDLLIEVGPGQVLSGLVSDFVDVPVVALDAGGPSLGGLLRTVGAAFALGVPVNHAALFEDRFTRPFDLDWRPRFFVNPCELAAVPEDCELSRQSSILDPQSAFELVRQLVANRAELPPDAVKNESRLLGDLHLNSISVSQILAEAARRLGLSPPVAPTDYATATVADIACSLEERKRIGSSMPADHAMRTPPGVDSWIRPFTVALAERPLPRRTTQHTAGPVAWRVIAPDGHPLRESLQRAFAISEPVDTTHHSLRTTHHSPLTTHSTSRPARAHAEGATGIVLCLPPQPDERHVGLFLEAARAALAEPATSHFVVVQHGGGGAGFARTLHLETPELTTCVVDVPLDHPKASEWVLAEAMAAVGYAEAHYDSLERRWEPVLRLLPLERVLKPDAQAKERANLPSLALQASMGCEPERLPLGPTDVLLVTGGGKGIAAESALALARETKVRLVLLGRSQPSSDAELAANLQRIAAAGIDYLYLVADVTDDRAVRQAISHAEADLGPITAILHGAGTNVPQLVSSLDEAAILRTVAPKVRGLRHVLAAVNPDHLRLLVTFGSIIARTGLRGEADYALANEWLARQTERWQQEHPHCRCLAIEWSVWSGVGMGQRLGRVDSLVQQGITPIPPDEGVRVLRRLLGARLPAVSIVVTGRFGDPPTLQLDQPELPLLRFLERPRVYYPAVELVADSELSADTDPYLNDHVFQGQKLVPAVIALEAMAQAAMAVTGSDEPPVFEDVRFNQPVVIPEGESVTIRVAALVREPGLVEMMFRSVQTAFQVNHFQATCRFRTRAMSHSCDVRSDRIDAVGLREVGERSDESGHGDLDGAVRIDPGHDLYGGLLFHGGRFRRLNRYHHLRATECRAEIKSDRTAGWFGRYLPATLVLGDPAVRDAAIHAVQACIPHATVLPIGVDRLVPGSANTSDRCFVHARERSRRGDTFIYDLDVTDSNDHLVERWEGLKLRIVSGTSNRGPWVEALLGPYIERRLGELLSDCTVGAVVEQNGAADRRGRSERAIQLAIGQPTAVRRRPDGKPEIRGETEVSAAHAGDLTLAVAGRGPLSCDLEYVESRSGAVWQDLLGTERIALAQVVVRETGEDQNAAATRVWAASECLKKAGIALDAPLTLGVSTSDGWVLLAAGPLVTATFVARVRGAENPLAVAVLVRSETWRHEPTNTGTWWASKRQTSSATSTT